MKLYFSLTYSTMWGESLCVDITYHSKDGTKRRNRLPMLTEDGQRWTLETAAIESRQHPIDSFTYIYKVVDGDGNTLRQEWNLVPRTFHFDSTKDYIMPDEWRDIPLQAHLYSRAYLTTIGGGDCGEVEAMPLPLFRRTLLFRVSAPQLLPGQSLAVCGSHPALGSWNVSRYLPMQYAGRQEWMLTVNVAAMLDGPIEYKYVVVDEQTHSLVSWEDGENRSTTGHDVADGQVLVLDGGVMRLREQLWKAAGVAVPVFSLRSETSYGVGDFGDLGRMVDWAAAVGMKLIQVLPVNDTTSLRGWMDSCPYDAISVYALHPHYVDLEAAGTLKDKDTMTTFHRRQRELNALDYSDYEAVDRVKMEYLHLLFAERGRTGMATTDFKTFVADNRQWLTPYAAFCSLRDKYGTAEVSQWPFLSHYEATEAEKYCEGDGKDDAAFIFYVQYLLHKQLKAAAEHARSKGVALMGDVPVCVGRNSVETWAKAHYFNLDAYAGTPPDYFSRNGQNWCAPTYNWEAVKADGYRWWHSRLKHMAQYFDAMRIDHVLGYFRIWEIPSEAVYGQLGHFSPSLPMTSGEIESFGLNFRKELFTRPFINDKVLSRLFGVHAQYVRDNFLTPKAYSMYDLRPEFSTQRKIAQCFDGKRDENSLWIRDGLMKLVADVLFVEDPHRLGMYHPRIEAFKEPIYEALEGDDKEAFMRLYNNYFYQRHNMYWGSQAMKRLPAVLEGSAMLVTAEDLGMLPDCVEPVLDALRILTLEVQTMPKQGGGYEFAHLGANPYRSVATFSTHDSAPMRLWWEDNRELAQRYYATMMQKEGRAPEHLTTVLAEEIIARHLYCPSMLCILSLQDWTAMAVELQSKSTRQERVNVPSDYYNRWQYRMNVTIEQLIEADSFNRKVKTMITRSKR